MPTNLKDDAVWTRDQIDSLGVGSPMVYLSYPAAIVRVIARSERFAVIEASYGDNGTTVSTAIRAGDRPGFLMLPEHAMDAAPTAPRPGR